MTTTPGPGPLVWEVSPRDGLQNEAVLLDTGQKLQLVNHALAAGARHIEVTSFVHPQRVPQMADAEALCAELPQRGDVTWSCLVLNQRGCERAVATGRLDEVGMVCVASDTFGMRNQGMHSAASVDEACRVLAMTRAAGLRPQVTIAVAFGCPFEGEVPAERVLAMAERLAAEAPVSISLADTIGVAVPGQVSALFAALRERLGPDQVLRAHFHDTRNTGMANAWAAWQAGVSELDASMGGIGGCPFAPGATGNIATCDLTYLFQRSGLDTGLDLERLREGAAWLETVLDGPVPSRLLRAGAFPEPVQEQS